jgi:hypothetical protein
MADRMEAHLEMLAVSETWDNGKPIRETLAADLPLAIDHFRYFAGCLRAQEGSLSQLDDNTVAYHFHEPLAWWAVHPLELPPADGGVEAWPRRSPGQLRRHEAPRSRRLSHPQVRRAGGGLAAPRCPQHREWLWN